MVDLAIRPKVVALFEDANKLLYKVKMEFSVQEKHFVRQSPAMRSILSPKLLIKDHKTINKKGEFRTMLVILAKHFTATFFNIGYLGSKKCLDKGKVNYSHVSTVRASELKERLEELKIKRDEMKISSVDAI